MEELNAEADELEGKEVGVAAGPFELAPRPPECGSEHYKQDDDAPPRGDFEDAIVAGLARPFDRARRSASRAVRNDEPLDDDDLRDEMMAALVVLLTRAALFRANALEEQYSLYLDDDEAEQEAMAWARSYARQRVDLMSGATLRAIERARDAESPDEAALIVERAFNEERRNRIGITEATAALAFGALLYKRLVNRQGADVDLIWYTMMDERVCPVCGPLHGTKQEVWGAQFPGGPPAHVRCRCGVEAKKKR